MIPKTIPPTDITDFRPIACCNFIYKVLAKVLCNRMKPLLTNLISENQCAFIKERSIAEGTMLVHEHIGNFNVKGADRICIKIDLKKNMIQ